MDLSNIAFYAGIRKIDYCEVVLRGRTAFAHSANDHSRDELHRTNSITKSVVSLLVGIAIEQGRIPGLQQPISSFFPNDSTLKHAGITIEHLLTMTPGWDWPEMGSWRGLPTPMTDSPDWVAYVFSRPIVAPPGTRMQYDSGSSHLLSAILRKTTGFTAAAFAERELFSPLGIESYEWKEDPNGISIGGFGLSLRPPDLTKLGLFMLNRGFARDEAIVGSDWIDASISPRFHTYDHIGSYGYHWWILTGEDDLPVTPRAYFAMGFGGQLIFVAPELELVVSFASYLGIKHRFLALQLCRELYESLVNRERPSG